MAKTPKSKTKGKPAIYRPAIVTFLDILGFRELIQRGGAAEVKAALDLVTEFTDPGDDAMAPVAIRFSDCIVRVRFVDGINAQWPSGPVFRELLDMVHAQGELANHNVILRGGVSFGDIFVEDGMVFGPALVSAYELESKVALYPRVVVDPALLNATKHDRTLGAAHHDATTDRKYIRNLLRRGESGFWFVDYLFAIAHEVDEPELEALFLVNHKKLVTSRYDDPKTRTAARDKILWLARYHNSRIATLPPAWFKAYGMQKKALTITTKELPELARLPKRSSTF